MFHTKNKRKKQNKTKQKKTNKNKQTKQTAICTINYLHSIIAHF